MSGSDVLVSLSCLFLMPSELLLSQWSWDMELQTTDLPKVLPGGNYMGCTMSSLRKFCNKKPDTKQKPILWQSENRNYAAARIHVSAPAPNSRVVVYSTATSLFYYHKYTGQKKQGSLLPCMSFPAQ